MRLLEVDTLNLEHLRGVGDNHEGVGEFWVVKPLMMRNH
jgi:hypothetical protein